jgi:hypothetical protein
MGAIGTVPLAAVAILICKLFNTYTDPFVSLSLLASASLGSCSRIHN